MLNNTGQLRSIKSHFYICEFAYSRDDFQSTIATHKNDNNVATRAVHKNI